MSSVLQVTFCGGWLVGLLALAVASDVQRHRIPNKVVLAGILAALALHAVLPSGTGLLDTQSPGGLGVAGALKGLATGIAVLLPFYLLRTMGAGDVKLMGMVGAFLGPLGALSAALMTMAAGGVLAFGAALANRSARRAITNTRVMVTATLLRASGTVTVPVEPGAASAGKLPYAVAIATGTVLHVILGFGGYSL